MHLVWPVALPYGRASDTLSPRSGFRCGQRGFKNSWVGSAAAEISFARFPHFGEGWIRVLFQISRDRCDKAGSAKAAHLAIVFDKGTLHRIHVFGRAQAFNGRQLLTDSINGKHQT